MKIDVHVLCKNEIKLAPFFIDYWRVLGDDVNVYVYDGSSSDGTRELFSNYEWIHIVDFEPDALEREFLARKNKRFKWNDIKENFNNYYKKRVDWSLWGGMRV